MIRTWDIVIEERDVRNGNTLEKIGLKTNIDIHAIIITSSNYGIMKNVKQLSK